MMCVVRFLFLGLETVALEPVMDVQRNADNIIDKGWNSVSYLIIIYGYYY